MTLILLLLTLLWALLILALFLWKKALFIKTWNEPYFVEAPILIESDDWGPGGSFHAERLKQLLAMLHRHPDSKGRPAILTADMVLSLPDTKGNWDHTENDLPRRFLDEDFPEILATIRIGMANNTLAPQLHGLEHLNGEAFKLLADQKDPRVSSALSSPDWWDWESLDSPLQAHYVDGSLLPTKSLSPEKIDSIVQQASSRFEQIFNHPTLSTVAPCYLWDDNVEGAWADHSINYIQTAGYRCPSRNAEGHYLQDIKLIRPGDRNRRGQIYLVRNVMYEPADGKNSPESAFNEALAAYHQALPITISTHRYNFTRSKEQFETSVTGLDRLLDRIKKQLPGTRNLSSSELGDAMKNPGANLQNPFAATSSPPLARLHGIGKAAAFLQRLRYRHHKLLTIAMVSGLIIPALVICCLGHNRRKALL